MSLQVHVLEFVLFFVASGDGLTECLHLPVFRHAPCTRPDPCAKKKKESEASLTSTSAPWTPGAGGVDLVEPPQTLEPLEPPAETSDASANETTTAAASGGGGQVPSAPRDVEAVIVSSRFVTLRWKEPLHSHGSVVGYSVLYRQDGSDRFVMEHPISIDNFRDGRRCRSLRPRERFSSNVFGASFQCHSQYLGMTFSWWMFLGRREWSLLSPLLPLTRPCSVSFLPPSESF